VHSFVESPIAEVTMLALAMGLLLAAPPALHLRLSAGAGLSHGLLGPRAELVFGHLGVFAALGLPQYAFGSLEGFGISPAGGIRYLATPDKTFSWFLSAQVAKFAHTIYFDSSATAATGPRRTGPVRRSRSDSMRGPGLPS
jgi:hypothetical protein